jgi:hypothetical protein
MVAVFLTAEAGSEWYGPQIREILARLGQPPASSSIPAASGRASTTPDDAVLGGPGAGGPRHRTRASWRCLRGEGAPCLT